MSGYDDDLAALDDAIAEARRKIDEGRVRDAEKERVRVKWIRALAYAIPIRRQVRGDRDYDALRERIEALEAGRPPVTPGTDGTSACGHAGGEP